ncbi:MAG: methyltransferase domain-containing protein [Rudaea sp.]|uniref:class I SAM-dependent methyltransferase n=1 Tax=Rudaea sp. TaxID=2136325 RepID=UPI0039E5DA25
MHNPNDPRWGQEGRESKAEAILKTMQMHTGQNLTDAVWLDIGCGSGGIAATLAEHVRQVVAVDPESWARWEAFRNAHPNLVFHKGTYCSLGRLLKSNSVDVVVCNQVYEHVDDPVALLRAIHVALKPGGLCYFAGPNLLWPIEPHVFWPFVHWFPRQFAQRVMHFFGSKRAHELDAWSWSYWRLTRAFAKTSFSWKLVVVERIRAEAALHDSWLLRLAARVPASLIVWLMPLVPAFIFVLTKPSAASLSGNV